MVSILSLIYEIDSSNIFLYLKWLKLKFLKFSCNIMNIKLFTLLHLMSRHIKYQIMNFN